MYNNAATVSTEIDSARRFLTAFSCSLPNSSPSIVPQRLLLAPRTVGAVLAPPLPTLRANRSSRRRGPRLTRPIISMGLSLHNPQGRRYSLPGVQLPPPRLATFCGLSPIFFSLECSRFSFPMHAVWNIVHFFLFFISPHALYS